MTPPDTGGLVFGDIVLVPFPFTNQIGIKRRPAVVISSDAYNQARPDIVLMAVTSQFRPTAQMGEVWVAAWEAAGLLKPSVVKPVLATFEQRLIIRRLGALADDDVKGLRQALSVVLG